MAVNNSGVSSSADLAPVDLLRALRGRSMAVNATWNMLGQVLPLLLAAVAIPILIGRLGVDRFGVLTLAWAIVGYFGLFDLGLGRSLTKIVSEALAEGKQAGASAAIWTATAILLCLGAVFTVAIWLLSHWLVYRVIKVPAALQHETLTAIYWLALSIPVITVTAGFRGVLEAQHRFGLVNVARVAMGAFSYAGPLVTAMFSSNLATICAVLVAGRMVAAIAHMMLCLKTLPSLRQGVVLEREVLPALVSTGAWITVSNTVAPILTYAERFLVGLLISVAAVAYYATPSEVVMRLLMIPAAITTVLFPAFAAFSVLDTGKLHLTYDRGIRFCFMLVFPALFLIILFAPEGLRLWLGPLFAAKSSSLLRWGAIGILVNSVAQIPYALLQAANRPDLPGKLHLIEVPLYLAALIAGIRMYGITGAAAVWSLRLIVEGLLLLWFVHRTLIPGSVRTPFLFISAAMVSTAVSILLRGLELKMIWCGLVLVIGPFIYWRLVLRDEERRQLSSLVPILRSKYVS
jgi:O-antigen/teichoic acid export membrane protein